MDERNQVELEKSLRETRYEKGLTLGELASIIKEILPREEVEALSELLYEDRRNFSVQGQKDTGEAV